MTTPTQAMRLPAPYGALIDRTRSIAFRFDGDSYHGFAGDTIASALAANDVRILSRSFKYHRPRGILSLAGNDANALVQIGPEPNVRADARLLEAGLVVSAQNVIGCLRYDAGRVIELLARFLPVGFYYHAFYWPARAWRFWEPVIRRAAGLGRVARTHVDERIDHLHRHTDVAVIGGGASGMAAALEAAANGADVILIDDGVELGGRLAYARFDATRDAATRLRADMRAAIAQEPRITVLSGATCSGWFADQWLIALASRRLYKIRAQAVVAATGTFEQPAVFRHNDRPGIMLASAAQRLIHLYGVRPGRRALVVTATRAGFGAALDLLEAGIEVAAVVDAETARAPCALTTAVSAAGIDILSGHVLREALSEDFGARLVGGVVEALGGGSARSVPCDLIVMSAGNVPAAQLVAQAGGDMVHDGARFQVRTPADGAAFTAGSLNGRHDLQACLADGRRAGWQAAAACGLRACRPEPESPAASPAEGWCPIVRAAQGREFVDLDEDLVVHDIEDTVAAGYTDLNLVKRYSTAVMGPSQGRYSALNTLRVATQADDRVLAGARLTTQRPPYVPEPIAHLAGRDRQPLRRTAMHDWHLAAGAHMMPAGTWHRPAHYGARQSSADAAAREAALIHQRVGLIDVSTLGKIEVRGPDAAEFIERLYTFRYAKQAAGRLRYVLMTDEAGVISDDGVAARFSDYFFYVTTTTTGADSVYRHMLRWQAQWNLAIDLLNVTSAWCGINVAGPAAREVLAQLVDDIDLGATQFGFSECRMGHLRGVPARLMRVGFVGELGWEVHVPAHFGQAIWQALMTAGEPHGIGPVGIEAQRILRLEKAHIIVSQDTDGLTYPAEVDMEWAVAREKPFFIGKRALEALDRRGLTRSLVGFRLDPDGPLPEECCLTVHGQEIVGRVTSVTRSAATAAIIGLAYVQPEQTTIGERFEIKLARGAGRISAEVAARPFYDPDNSRQKL